MAATSYMDEQLDMLCDGLFDNIDDLLDFSNAGDILGDVDCDSTTNGGNSNDECDAKKISNYSTGLMFPDSSEVCYTTISDNSDENKLCDVTCEDWTFNLFDECSFNIDNSTTDEMIAVQNNENIVKIESPFRSCSPVSVLEPNNFDNIGKEKVSSALSSPSSSLSSNVASSVIENTVLPTPMVPTVNCHAHASTILPDGKNLGAKITQEDNKSASNINASDDWTSNFLEDYNFNIDFSASTAVVAAPKSFRPVCTLESNIFSNADRDAISSSSSSLSSCTNTNESEDTYPMSPVGPTMSLIPARARSKRPRRPALLSTPIVPPLSEGPPCVPTILPECDSFEKAFFTPPMKKKKKNNPSICGGDISAAGNEGERVGRKCLHCGIQKTPQWRAGPMGPKTLCNACGVRYKSGRLFPEYRPAASPTFVESIHSNSHKKVVEMRIKACQRKTQNGMQLPRYPAAKNCELLAYIK